MNQDDWERVAAELRLLARIPRGEVWLSTEVMRSIYGPESVGTIKRMLSPACLIWTEKGPKIILREGANDLNFRGFHELGHLAWRLFQLAGTRAEEERAASAIGAAIMAPPESVRRAHNFYGEKLRPLAKAFVMSQTSMNLRLGEVFSDDRAIVTKNTHVMKRGWATVDDRLLIRWKTEPPPLGIVKVRLTGSLDEGRVALRKKSSK